MMLKQQRFLTEAGKRGLMVAPLDRDFVRWIYELRLGIDPLAASLAAQRALPREIGLAHEILEAGARATREMSIDELIAADMKFHMHLYEMSGNELFVQIMSQFWNHLRRAMREVLLHRRYRVNVWREHAGMLDAIERHDAGEAGALARAHLANAAGHVRLDLEAAGESVPIPNRLR